MKSGVCGKQPEVASLQDLLTYALTGLSIAAVEARKVGITNRDINVFTCEALFTTVTNVNFDPARFAPVIHQCVTYRDTLIEEVRAASGKVDLSRRSVLFQPAGTLEALGAQGEKVGLKSYPAANPDILSLKHILLFGLRGIAAYTDHARILGKEDEVVYAFIHEGLAALANENLNLEESLDLVLKCGETNLKAMELLDAVYVTEVPVKEAEFPAGQGEDDAVIRYLFHESGVVIAARFGPVTTRNQKEMADVFVLHRSDDVIGDTQDGVPAESCHDIPAVCIGGEAGELQSSSDHRGEVPVRNMSNIGPSYLSRGKYVFFIGRLGPLDTVRRHEDSPGELGELLRLVLPGRSVMAVKMFILLESRIAVAGKHFTVGVYINSLTLGLLEEFFQILEVVPRHQDRISLLCT